MADANVLKSFLVNLGFTVDTASSNAFSNAVIFKTNQVIEFAKTVEEAAVKVVAGVGRIASELENLYFASQRTGAAAENIRAMGFAADRLGSSVGGARASLEAFRTFLGASPGADSLLASLGIDPNQDTEHKLEQFGQYLRSLPEYLQRARAAQFGIDWHTALALMSDDFVRLRNYQENLFVRFGINQKQATEQAHLFENQISFLGTVFEAMRIKVTTILQQRLGTDIQRFREFVENNFDRISIVFESVGKVILFIADKVLSVFTTIGQDITDLINWWNQLDPVQKNTIKTVGELAAAILLLNTAILSNPIALFATAILFLVDDFLAWKRHSDSLIDWEKWMPQLERAYNGLKVFGDWLQWGVDKLGGWQTVAEGIIIFMAGRWVIAVASWGASAVAAFGSMVTAINPVVAALAAMVALGVLANKIFSSDAVRTWIYEKIPGSEAATKWLYDHTGGHVGKTQEEIDEIKKRAAGGGGATSGSGSQTGDDLSLIDRIMKRFETIPGSGAGAGQGQTPQGHVDFSNIEKATGLPPGFLDKQWAAESGRGQFMMSPKGAAGHFGFMPDTAKEMGLDDPNDVNKSAVAAGRYMNKMLELFHGNIRQATAAYNWGPGHVRQDISMWGEQWEEHLPNETRGYLKKILDNGAQSQAPATPPNGTSLIPSPTAANTNPQQPPLKLESLNQPNQGSGNANQRMESNINIYGSTADPKAVAREIIEEQHRQLMEMQRNSQSAVR